VTSLQGDQIGRIFANWAIVLLCAGFLITEVAPNFWSSFYHGKSYAKILTMHALGIILGRFFSLTHLVTLRRFHFVFKSRHRSRLSSLNLVIC
jgi:hypothetical protein